VLLVDTSVLLAVANRSDPDHEASAAAVESTRPLVTTPLVVAETAYLIGRTLGQLAEASFFGVIASGELNVDVLTLADAGRIAELITTYRDLRLGGTDASLVTLAERYGVPRIATLDRRHFTVVRPSHATAFELVPA
jgi:predicted nucleic acid-binding protein